MPDVGVGRWSIRTPAEATELAVELAGTILREQVGSEDQQRLFDEFLQRIGDAPRPGNGS